MTKATMVKPQFQPVRNDAWIVRQIKRRPKNVLYFSKHINSLEKTCFILSPGANIQAKKVRIMTSPSPEGKLSSPPVEISFSRQFLQWLSGLHVSLAFTTYQSFRLFLIGLKPNGRLSAMERLFDRAMGLCAPDQLLYMSSRYQLWKFENALSPDESFEGYDRLYVPRLAYTTGDIDIHDIAVDKDDRVIFVNTLHSCLATVSEHYSFTPLWKPPFISKLAPEDRCHLNGLAMVDGEPGYVTSVSRADVPSGWRDRREAGGCLIDVRSNEIICDGLSMPHSPRYHQDRLWLLNSGTGELGYVDLDKGAFEPIAFCPGYLRGLAFVDNYAVVGLSKSRRIKAFSGLELDDRLTAKDAEARCGLYIVDLNRGDIAHWMQIEGVVSELYDVQVLPGTRCPSALGVKSDEIARVITMDTAGPVEGVQGGLYVAPPTEDAPTQAAPSAQSTPLAYEFHLHSDLDEVQAMEFDAFSFPRLSKLWYANPPKGQMTAVIASLQGRTVGLGMAEIKPDDDFAELISLFVLPDHRHRGLGARLMAGIEQALIRQDCAEVIMNYQSDWPSLAAIERLIKKREWSPPEDTWILCRQTTERIADRAWLKEYKVSEDYDLFPWNELTEKDRQYIQSRQEKEQWFPEIVSPFQEEARIEPINSIGLKFEGKVVGWMITHRTAPDTIQYTALFMDRDHRREGQASGLQAESINRQVASDVPNMIWTVHPSNTAMLKMISRSMSENRHIQSSRRISRKRLARQH